MGYGESVKVLCEEIIASRQARHETLSALQGEVKNLIDDLGTNRTEMRTELSKTLQEHRKNIKKAVREDLAALCADRQARNAQMYGMLESSRQARLQVASNLRSNLVTWHKEMSGAVQEQLKQYSLERTEARQAWGSMYQEMPASIQACPEVSAPTETVEEVEDQVEIKNRILAYINSHPEGVKLTDIESSLNLARIRAGALTRQLVDEEKIQKDDFLYVPIREYS